MKRITVLGAGTMGHGIAHAAIAGGFDTQLYDVSDAAVAKGRAAIAQVVAKGVELGRRARPTLTRCCAGCR
jgi:3-hydroxyacyl-CoA dehydrogenase